VVETVGWVVVLGCGFWMGVWGNNKASPLRGEKING